MEDIKSIKQVEEMEPEELEARMRTICENYLTIIPGSYSEGFMLGDVPVAPEFVPSKVDCTKLIEAKDLPSFTFELILAFLSAWAWIETSGCLEGEYCLDYYGMLGAVAQNQSASAEVLDQIAKDLFLCDSEDTDPEDEYRIALLVLEHKNCSSKTVVSLIEGGWGCCKKRFLAHGYELIEAGTRHPNLTIEALLALREQVASEQGEHELDQAEDEDEDPPVKIVLDTIEKGLLAKGYKKLMEWPTEGYSYRQARIF